MVYLNEILAILMLIPIVNGHRCPAIPYAIDYVTAFASCAFIQTLVRTWKNCMRVVSERKYAVYFPFKKG